MKTKLLFIALLSVFHIQCLTSLENKVLFLGTIQFPSEVHNPPTLTVLYKGKEYQVESDNEGITRGYFELYDTKNRHELYVLITEYLELPESADIQYLKTSQEHSYRLFKLIRKKIPLEKKDQSKSSRFNKPEFIETWIIEEMPTKESIRIPDNTLIFFMNPEFIETLQAESWHSNDNIIKLPKIVFRNTVDEKTLQDIGVKMLSALLDFKPLHKRSTKTSIMFTNNLRISLPNSRSLS